MRRKVPMLNDQGLPTVEQREEIIDLRSGRPLEAPSISPGAIVELRRNPQLATYFDETFGPGASFPILASVTNHVGASACAKLSIAAVKVSTCGVVKPSSSGIPASCRIAIDDLSRRLYPVVWPIHTSLLAWVWWGWRLAHRRLPLLLLITSTALSILHLPGLSAQLIFVGLARQLFFPSGFGSELLLARLRHI